MQIARLIAIVSAFTGVDGVWIVNDFRIQDKDVTPALGRGYNPSSGKLYSNCLIVNGQTSSTFDYDFIVQDNVISSSTISNSPSISPTLTAIFSRDSDWPWLRSELLNDLQLSASNPDTSIHQMIMAKKVDRYYSSAKGSEVSYDDSVENLLQSGKIMTFFQSC